MLALVFFIALPAIPAVLAWFLFDLLPFSRRIWPKILGALGGGLLISGMLMWEDAQEGFCCREYIANAYTELWFYIPVGLVFSLAAYPFVALASYLKLLYLRKRNAENLPIEIFE